MPKKKSKKRTGKKFGEKEFVNDLWGMMKKQAKANPMIARLHERLSPEYEQVSELVKKLLTSTQEAEKEIVENILEFRNKALLPLIDFIKGVKSSRP